MEKIIDVYDENRKLLFAGVNLAVAEALIGMETYAGAVVCVMQKYTGKEFVPLEMWVKNEKLKQWYDGRMTDDKTIKREMDMDEHYEIRTNRNDLVYEGDRDDVIEWLDDKRWGWYILNIHCGHSKHTVEEFIKKTRFYHILELVREAIECQDPNAHACEITRKIVDIFEK